MVMVIGGFESGDFFGSVFFFESESFGDFFGDFLGGVGSSILDDFGGVQDEDGCGAKLLGLGNELAFDDEVDG